MTKEKMLKYLVYKLHLIVTELISIQILNDGQLQKGIYTAQFSTYLIPSFKGLMEVKKYSHLEEAAWLRIIMV